MSQYSRLGFFESIGNSGEEESGVTRIIIDARAIYLDSIFRYYTIRFVDIDSISPLPPGAIITHHSTESPGRISVCAFGFLNHLTNATEKLGLKMPPGV